MSEASEEAVVEAAVESPPAADRPAAAQEDPRARLHELARRLTRTRDRAALMEYLRLRRALM